MSGNDKKGFSGLSNIETKVDDIAPSRVSKIETETQTTNQSEPVRDNRPPISAIPIQEPTPIVDFLKRYWVVIGIGIFLIWAFSGNSGSSSSSSSRNYTLTESLPPYGSGKTLNSSQIYYCLAENVRIDANKATINYYDNYSIERFNRTVDDYNARCSNFSYKQSAMNAAQKALDSNRYLIQSQGSSRM